jgi:hypothetical protein
MTFRIRIRFLATAPLLLAATLHAQGVLPDRPLPTPVQPAQPVPAGGTAGNYSSSTVEGGADRLFDVKSDSVDLENGTMNWKGKTFNLGDTRLMRARFERYLATPQPTHDYDEYMRLLASIEARVSSMNFSDSDANRTRNLQEAWNLLFEASKSEYDNNASLTLANQVMKAWRERNELNNLSITLAQEEQLQKQQDAKLHDRADAVSARKSGTNTLVTKTKEGVTTSTTTGTGVAGERELITLEQDRAEAKVGLVKGGARQALMGVQSKLEFQSTIVTFLSQRRFRHTLLANAFYRQIYKASHQQVQVGDKQMKELFPLSNFVPSLETLDTMAREAIGDVATGLRAFTRLDGMKDRHAAFERLQETFFLGEYEPDIVRLDYAGKRIYVELARDMRDLQKFGDERDLDAVEETLGRICAVASDFPAARIRSKIRTARQASDMAVLAAKQTALISGKDGADKVAEHLATAAKLWPLNPGIKNFMTEMTGRADLVSQRMPEFDKLHDAGKFRELYDRKEEFAVALLQDKPRLDKLNAVLQKVGRTEALAAQAEALAAQGNRYLAWDAVVEAGRDAPTDPKLASLRSVLAPQVADYAKLLADAARAESENRPGSAIAAYLAAQDLNRGSKFCQDAIDRAARAMLDDAPTK